MKLCKHCNFDCTTMTPLQMANHVRWCKENPSRQQYVADLATRSKLVKENQYTKAKKEGKPIPTSPLKGKQGTFLGKTHSPETRKIIQEKALASNHRRLVRSIREYKTVTGEIVLLDSSWEEYLAKRLDVLGIKWIRPDPLKWVDSTGKSRNYFPDFYLIDYDLYLDPKNPMAMNQQKEKVEWLKHNVRNLVFLTSEAEIKNYTPVA